MIDSHCHLNDDRFDQDREEIIFRAKEVGLFYIVNIGSGYGVESNYESLKIAKDNQGYIFSTAGIHPHDAKLYDSKVEKQLRKLVEDNREIIVAIGEIGLDYHYNFSDSEVQKKVFREMIHMARDYSLPLIIHSREAEPDTFRILKEEKAEEIGGVMHCFSGDAELAKRYIDELGFYISISGIVTFKNAVKTREVVEKISLGMLLAETDAPYLTPVPYRGKRNEPAYVRYVYEKIAEIKGKKLKDVVGAIDQNVVKLFHLPVLNN